MTRKTEIRGIRLRFLRRLFVPALLTLPAFPESTIAAPPVDLVESSIVRVVVGGGSGTGWVVSPGVVATNWHVTDGQAVFRILPAGTGNEYRGDLIWQGSAARDIALIGVRGLDLTPLKLLTDDPVRGNNSYTVGFPGLGDDITGQANTNVSVYGGIIALVQETIDDVRLVQHTNIVNAGNSGGPLMDDCGRVQGLTTWGFENEHIAAGLIWASVHVSELARQMDELAIPYETDNSPCGTNTGVNTEQLENLEDRLATISDSNIEQREIFEDRIDALTNRWSIGVGVVLAAMFGLTLTFSLALRRQRRLLGAEFSMADAVRSELERLRDAGSPARRQATDRHLVAGRAQLKRLRAGVGSTPITLGSSPECELVIRQSVVSAEHARIGWDRDTRKFWLEDLESTNGTFLGIGTRLVGGNRYRLNDGDSFFLVHEGLGFYVLSPH